MLPVSASTLPILTACILVTFGGVFLLEKSERQQRDTTRKHHIEDIEQALYFARNHNGTYPPYDQSQWCGVLNDPDNGAVLAQVEAALRDHHEKYANPDKPFPFDPNVKTGEIGDYFYWKRSPASFELYSVLETDQTGERDTRGCDNAPSFAYDYGVSSVWREPGARKPVNTL